MLTACGGEQPGADDDPTATPQTPAATDSPDAPSAEPAALTVQATEYAFTLPDEVPAGPVRITLENVGGTTHEASLARIPAHLVDAVEQGRYEQVVSDATFLGGPSRIAPGATSPAVGAALEPGTYAFLCFFPDADGAPHVERGMMQAFEVTGEADSGLSPPGGEDATFVLDNFSIEIPEDFDGTGSFTIDNQDDIEHEVQIYAVPDATREEDVASFLEDRCRATDCTPAGGMSGLRYRKQASLDLDLDAGTYVLACFIPEAGGDGEPAAGQPPHWKGQDMWELITVS